MSDWINKLDRKGAGKAPVLLVPFLLLCALLLPAAVLHANPGGASVVRGQVAFTRPDAATFNITNSPGAIINWQQFSIAPGETTRFIQQGAGSAVLNRVTGQDPSRILGSLQSNGRVFLINPNGVIFGQNAVVNTAGLIASTLDIANRDFINGRLHFSDLENTADILNRGFISASGNGEVVFVAPKVRNEGVIQVEQGSIVLAAGQSVSLSSLNYRNIEFEVQAPDNSVVNLGKMLSDGGSIGVFAGSIHNSGVVSANAVSVDNAGNIVFVAQNDTVIEDGTVTASSKTGRGGTIHILGERVGLFGKTVVDASGDSGGGEVLVGGDYQGANPAVNNAKQTVVSAQSRINVDATGSGNGGRAVVWADGSTDYRGEISARGGSLGGDGGFVEVSGKQGLAFDGFIDTSAINGRVGSILLDPDNILIQTAPGANDGNVGGTAPNIGFGDNAGTDYVIGVAVLEALVGDITLQAEVDITLQAGATLNLSNQANGDTVTFQAGNNILIAGDISLAGGNLLLSAADPGAAATSASGGITVDGQISTNDGDLALNTNGSAGDIVINNTIDAGVGTIDLLATNGDVRLDNGTTLNNQGTLNLNAQNLLLENASELVNNGQLNIIEDINIDSTTGDGSMTLSSGVLSIAAGKVARLNNQLTWQSGIINGGGTFLVAGTAGINLVTVADHIVDGLTTIDNQGTINMSTGTLMLNNASVFDNNGRFVFLGTANMLIDTQTALNPGIFNNRQLLESLTTGTASIGAGLTYTHSAATVDIASGSTLAFGAPLVLDAGSVLQGSGELIGDVDNTAGTVRPGGESATGTLSITGNYNQQPAGRLEIDIAGTTDYDKLVVSGTATLAGDLTVSEINGYEASISTDYDFITASIINGAFSGKNIFPVGFERAAVPTAGIYRITDRANNTIFFDNYSGNLEWNTASNWSTGQLPLAGYDVDASSVTAGTMLISSGDYDINSLRAATSMENSGGRLRVAGDVSVPDNFSYTQTDDSAFTQFDGGFNTGSSQGVRINNNRGELQLNGNTVADVDNQSALYATGSITGNVSSSGLLSAGSGAGETGLLTVNGNLTLTESSVITMDIAGREAGTGYDSIVVNGSLQQAGDLNVLVNESSGYIAAIGDSFDVFRFNASSGSIAINPESGYVYNAELLPDRLRLVATAIPGQFLRDTQNDVVTFLDMMHRYLRFESIDDILRRLENSRDEETDKTLICS